MANEIVSRKMAEWELQQLDKSPGLPGKQSRQENLRTIVALYDERDTLKAEVERMRPVVQSAKEYKTATPVSARLGTYSGALIDAVTALEQAERGEGKSDG